MEMAPYTLPTVSEMDPDFSATQHAVMALEEARALNVYIRKQRNEDILSNGDFINNVEALKQAYEGLAYANETSKAIPWIETLTCILDELVALDGLNAAEDFRREERFSELSLKGAVQGLERILAMNLKFNRPKDFMAEMLKSDQQMAKIKTRLDEENRRLEIAQKNLKEKRAKKFSSSIKAEKARQRQKEAAKIMGPLKTKKKKISRKMRLKVAKKASEREE